MSTTYAKMQEVHYLPGCYVAYLDKQLLTTRYLLSHFAVLLFAAVRT